MKYLVDRNLAKTNCTEIRVCTSKIYFINTLLFRSKRYYRALDSLSKCSSIPMAILNITTSHGTPMGSPISVVLSDLFMQKLEEEIFLNAPYQPIFWKRYLYDIITVLPRDFIYVFWIILIVSMNISRLRWKLRQITSFPILILILSVKKMDILCLMSTANLPTTTTT